MNIEQYPIKIEGSVKNIRVVREVTDAKMGKYIFEFTDDTSVKDRGKLGFKTENKGASMCATAVYNFKRLEESGMPTIFLEQVADNAILVDGIRIIDPDEVDISEVEDRNRLFPLEVITRDVITETSSAARRLKSGKLSYEALGLSQMPEKFPVFLPKTYVDGSTKLRGSDEYLPWDQLQDLCKAPTADINTVQRYVLETARFGMQRGSEVGFLVFDKKEEFAYDEDGELVLADVPLCLDEITGAMVGSFYDINDFRGEDFKVFRAGVQHEGHINASKQLYRDHYDAKHPEWCKAVKDGLKAGVAKADLPPAPQPPEALVSIVSDIYQAFANAWTGKEMFTAPPLSECVQDYWLFAQRHYEV